MMDSSCPWPLTYRRARHVVTENAWTRMAAQAMTRGDGVGRSELMNLSPEFPDALLYPGQTFRSPTIYRFITA